MASFQLQVNRLRSARRIWALSLAALFALDIGLHMEAVFHLLPEQLAQGIELSNGESTPAPEEPPCGIPGHCCSSAHHHHVASVLSASNLTIPITFMALTHWVPLSVSSSGTPIANWTRAPPGN